MGLFDRFKKDNDKKTVQPQTQYSANQPQSQTQKKQYSAENLKVSFESAIDIDACITELKEAGYGDSAIESFKREVNDIIDQKTNDFLNSHSEYNDYLINSQIDDISRTIQLKKRTRLLTIKEDRELSDELISNINQNELSDNDKLFELLYGKEYKEKNGVIFSEYLTKANIKIEQNLFKSKHGHSENLADLSNLLITKLSLYGYGVNAIKLIQEQFNQIIQAGANSPEKASSDMYNLANQAIRRNQSNIEKYFYGIDLLDDISKKCFPKLETINVIKNFLAFDNQKLDSYYKYVDQNNPNRFGLTFEQQLNDIIPPIEMRDSNNRKIPIDLEKVESILYPNDKTTDRPQNSTQTRHTSMSDSVKTAITDQKIASEDVQQSDKVKQAKKQHKQIRRMG